MSVKDLDPFFMNPVASPQNSEVDVLITLEVDDRFVRYQSGLKNFKLQLVGQSLELELAGSRLEQQPPAPER